MNNWCAGGDLAEIAAMTLKIEDYSREQKCHRMVGNGRKGWLRVFEGYTEYGFRKAKNLVE